MQAIVARLLVNATYNGKPLRLAPHQLYERHGELFIGAFNPDKSRRSDEEPQLGHFKLVGLSDLALIEETFEPIAAYDGTLPREDDVEVVSVERD